MIDCPCVWLCRLQCFSVHVVTSLSVDSPSLGVQYLQAVGCGLQQRLIPLFISEFLHARYTGNVHVHVQVYCHAVRLVVFMFF